MPTSSGKNNYVPLWSRNWYLRITSRDQGIAHGYVALFAHSKSVVKLSLNWSINTFSRNGLQLNLWNARCPDRAFLTEFRYSLILPLVVFWFYCGSKSELRIDALFSCFILRQYAIALHRVPSRARQIRKELKQRGKSGLCKMVQNMDQGNVTGWAPYRAWTVSFSSSLFPLCSNKIPFVCTYQYCNNCCYSQ